MAYTPVPAVGQTTMSASLPVVIASDQSAVPVTSAKGTPTQSVVAGSDTSVTLLSANSSRKKLVIFNDSQATLYIRLNASAADATNYTYQVPPQRHIMEDSYTGEVRGIWSVADGNARVTEFI